MDVLAGARLDGFPEQRSLRPYVLRLKSGSAAYCVRGSEEVPRTTPDPRNPATQSRAQNPQSALEARIQSLYCGLSEIGIRGEFMMKLFILLGNNGMPERYSWALRNDDTGTVTELAELTGDARYSPFPLDLDAGRYTALLSTANGAGETSFEIRDSEAKSVEVALWMARTTVGLGPNTSASLDPSCRLMK